MNLTPIPCPICGKRLFDFRGDTCPLNFELLIKCRNTKSCGVVKINTQYIEKMLAKKKDRGKIATR